MTSEQLLERITIDPAVCHGQPCIKGTRVLVTVVLDALAAGLGPDEIVTHYPTLAFENPSCGGLRSVAGQAGNPRTVSRLVRIKLDENLTMAAQAVLIKHGHDVHT
ncbi:MAG: DUF433 domain-containing protein, partial [Pseudonocardiaceae bacterium]